MIALLLLACSTEVGLLGYTDKQQDTSTVIVDSAEPSMEPSEPSEEPSMEPSGEPSGERVGISGYTHLHLRQVACPACVGESQEIRINFAAEFHQPISDNHTEWIPEVGECTNSLTGINPSTIPINVGPSISISNPSHNFVAPAVGTGFFQTENIFEAQLQRDALYEVQTDEGSYSFFSSRGFDFIEPYNMFYVDPSYAFDAAINRSGASFSWAPTSINSVFMIRIAAYSGDGSVFFGHATCVGEDNGFMTVPAEYLSIFPAGSLAAIHLARHKVELVETDINNSYIETHMEWEVVGTGFLQ